MCALQTSFQHKTLDRVTLADQGKLSIVPWCCLSLQPTAATTWCTVVAGDAAAGGNVGTYLTLRRLQLWLSEPLRRMRLLAALVDAADGRIGGDLAGRVWAASKVGDPVARGYATRILQQVCVYVCMFAWCAKGAEAQAVWLLMGENKEGYAVHYPWCW